MSNESASLRRRVVSTTATVTEATVRREAALQAASAAKPVEGTTARRLTAASIEDDT
jgi:hypothetical protein